MDCVSDLGITNNLFAQPETAAIGHDTVRPIRLTRKGPTFLTGAAYISHKREVVPLAAGGQATFRKSPFEVAPGTMQQSLEIPFYASASRCHLPGTKSNQRYERGAPATLFVVSVVYDYS